MEGKISKRDKYAIYGMNRVTKGFLYVFDDLTISMVYDDAPNCEEWRGFPVSDIRDYTKESGKLILCGFDKREGEAQLKALGFKYEKDYFYEEDFFFLLDDGVNIPQNKEIVVWGTGQMAKVFMEKGKKLSIKYFLDSYAQKNEFYGLKVMRPGEVKSWNEVFVIIAAVDDREIRNYLLEKHLVEGTDFTSYRNVMYDYPRMLKQTLFAEEVYDFSCDTMLNHLEVAIGGKTVCCCSTFLDEEMGSILEKGVSGVWNSAMHKILCLSTQNRTYTFCKRDMCPYFINRTSRVVAEKVDWEYEKMESKPEVLAIGYDKTCNLSCETCRKELHIAGEQEAATACAVGELVRKELLPRCQFFILAGNGEVFASRAYAKAYESSESADIPYIRILSNGTLFNSVNWKRFKQGKIGKIMVTFSIDAAREATYEDIRRGGKFDVVRKNMEFAAELRKQGELAYFRMNFVVQKKNYEEMPEFVRWGEELGADEVFFTKILNWGTFTEEEFREVSMMQEDGITPKPELEEVLQDPMMKHRIVDLGTIRYSHKAVEGNKFHNYYMWELERKVPGLFQ
ncbi:MAG: hypothetical protein HFH89_09830 [Lachnospiraceae bacterium]|nr:hypothetical protein [uncultured Acetatifactor sp.]MCI8287934.1 hypothetical protein [Lachnospiraceae bacterium]